MAMNRIINKNGPCNTSCNLKKVWKWDVSPLLASPSQSGPPHIKYAVIVLNRPLTQRVDFIKDLWNSAAVRITVDGGTDHWETFLKKLSAADQQIIKAPDLITGDFDSIRENTLAKYKKKGCKHKDIILTQEKILKAVSVSIICIEPKNIIVHTPDQDHTDFTKALMQLEAYCQEQKIEDLDHVVTICQSSGRIDQILSNIHSLFLVTEMNLLRPTSTVYLLSDDSISWLLEAGEHEISVPEQTRLHKKAWCSLIPIGECCDNVKTSGLKWNLNNQPLRYGLLVSSSNAFDGAEKVKINCSHRLLWSMNVPSIASKL